jgi:ATP-dependent 26S proteasome regulatory subunit
MQFSVLERSVATEAGMYAIRARRKTVTERDFLDAVNKVRTRVLPHAPAAAILCRQRICTGKG